MYNLLSIASFGFFFRVGLELNLFGTCGTIHTYVCMYVCKQWESVHVSTLICMYVCICKSRGGSLEDPVMEH